MSDFWSVDGEEVATSTSHKTEGGGSPMPIPAGTRVKALVSDVKWETSEREGTYIQVNWEVMAPKCYSGRTIRQKLHVKCHEYATAPNWVKSTPEQLKKKRMAALRMLAAIDGNAGGKIHASRQQPDDAMLQKCLMAKQMTLSLEVFVSDKDSQTGQKIENEVDYFRTNWVRGVDPSAAFQDMSKEDQESAVASTNAEWTRMLEAAGGQRAPREPRPQGGQGGQGGGQQQRPQAQGGAQSPAAGFDAFDDDIPF